MEKNLVDEMMTNETIGVGKSVKPLDSQTASLIRNTQVITKISDVVRELVENSIDAGATSVQVYLANNGLDKIEVKDNGSGIQSGDIGLLFKGGHTSKLTDSNNLSRGQFLGFRGEALHALCTSADVTISTKPDSDSRATKYQLNHQGVIVSQSQVALNRGTVITAEKLFANHPVRRQFHQNDKTSEKEINDIQAFLKALAIAIPKCHLGFFHNNNLVWNKASVTNHHQAIITVLGNSISKQMVKIGPVHVIPENLSPDENKVKTVEMYMPKKPVDMRTMSFTSNKMTMIFCNNKRVYVRAYEKLIHRYVVSVVEKSLPSDQRRFPISVVLITVPPQDVDFNRNVDKSKVHMVDKDVIYNTIEEALIKFYGVDLKETSTKGLQDKDTSIVTSKNTTVTDKESPRVVIPGPIGNLQPVIAPTSVSGTREKAVATFLQDIPTSAAFSRSPSKPPGLEPTVVSFPVSKPSVDKQAIAELPLTSGDSRRRNSSGSKHIVSNFNIFIDSQEEESQIHVTIPAEKTCQQGQMPNNKESSTSSTNGSTEIKINDWLEGRLHDKNGQILQNVKIVTEPAKAQQSDAKLAYERFREALFANRRGSGGSKNSFTSTPRESIIAGPPHKKAKSDLNSSVSSVTQSSIPSTSTPSSHRQVTLESLSKWSTPSTIFSQAASTSVAGVWRLPLTPDSHRYLAEIDASARMHRESMASMSPPPAPYLSVLQREEEQATSRRTKEQLEFARSVLAQPNQQEPLVSALSMVTLKPMIIGRVKERNFTGPLYTMKVKDCVGVFSPKNMVHYFPDDCNVLGDLENVYSDENKVENMFKIFLATRKINESLEAEKIFHVLATTASLALVYNMKSHRTLNRFKI